MGKITVKHYLNTNLRPYIIRGEKYYSIYVLVTANRQNTKVKSLVFNELYTENDFEEIITSKSLEDASTLEKEKTAIQRTLEILIEICGNFDASLFSVFYGFVNTFFVLDIEYDFLSDYERGTEKTYVFGFNDKRCNKFKLNIKDFFKSDYSIKENETKGMSIFTFLSDEGQQEFYSFLKKNEIDNKEEVISIINKYVVYASLEKLGPELKDGKSKNSILYDKYRSVFDYLYSYKIELKKIFGCWMDTGEYEKMSGVDIENAYLDYAKELINDKYL